MTDVFNFVPSQRSFGGDIPELDPELLARVDRPSRYLGGEVGQVKKDLSRVSTRVGLCYPDLYEIGMSHIGLKILYSLLNAREDVAAERVYAVGVDMEQQMRSRNLQLSTLENRIPLAALDILGFTLQYELSYTNLLQVLDLGRIPLRAAGRTKDHPLVIAGGPCAFNPEPLAAVLDAVCLGDGEETIVAVVEAHQRWRQSGQSRRSLLGSLTEIPGVYVPSLYTVEYESDGRVAGIIPQEGLPSRIRKAIVTDIDSAPYPTATPVPFTRVVHDRVGVEIQRGCMRGCRFCQAGYIYRPERQRSPQTIQRLVREGLAATGQEEYSLLSLSAGDYNCVEPLLTALMDEHEVKRSAISLPSMRLETLSPAIIEQIGRVRKTSFTVAPEAATDRLRAVINKVIDEEVLIDMVEEVFQRGWRNLKFYFMLGIPTEQWEDLEAIVDLGRRCLRRARRHQRGANITVSVSSFVPKSHTPFQWAPQISLDEIRQKQGFLRRELGRAKLGFRYHDSRSSVMEGIYSRGDRRSGEALLRAYERGARMDGWQEHFSEEVWHGAFEETGLEPAFYNQRRRDSTEVLPWSHVDIGMKPEWLWHDWMDALEAGFVPDCSDEPCYDCGVCDHKVVHNVVFDSPGPESTPVHRARKKWNGLGVRKQSDPQFVAMPRPPGKKANNVVDAAPPQGMAPGSSGARAARLAQAEKERLRGESEPEAAAAAPQKVPPEVPGSRGQGTPGARPWDGVYDTRLPKEWRLRLEIRYGKVGSLVHLGHLEVASAFRRALKRVDAPVLWSQGFHPAMRLAFGPPLPSGMASVAEYAELELKRPIELGRLAEGLKAAMPDGLPIVTVKEVPIARPALAPRMEKFVYRVDCFDEAARAACRAEALYSAGQPLEVEVVKKKKTRIVDVRPAILALDVLDDGGFALQVKASGAGARIRDVLRALFGDEAAACRSGWGTTRMEVHFSDDAAPSGPLVVPRELRI